jgi:hypothetical protein
VAIVTLQPFMVKRSGAKGLRISIWIHNGSSETPATTTVSINQMLECATIYIVDGWMDEVKLEWGIIHKTSCYSQRDKVNASQ